MKNFIGSRVLPSMAYHRPETLDEAIDLLRAAPLDYRILAGGTDIIPKIRTGMIHCNSSLTMLDITRIKGMKGVSEDGGFIQLGAATRLSEIACHPIITSGAPLLSEAVQELGSSQVRNSGTIGGNLCTASPAADAAPPLLAMDAQAIIRGSDKDRVTPLDRFFKGPGLTTLNPRELLTEIRIPLMEPGERCYRVKLGRRNAFCISIISLAIKLKVEDGVFRNVRIALGAVAPTPVRAYDAEEYLIGREVSPEAVDQGAKLAAKQTAPISDVRAGAEYRQDMARVLTRRGLLSCIYSGDKKIIPN